MQLVPLNIDHLRYITEINKADSFNVLPNAFPAETLAKAYLSPGSVAFCLMNNEPVIAGGIVNLDWHRGEAWLMHTKKFYKYFKTSLQTLKQEFPKVAVMNGFRRVQATSFTDNEILFEFLDFECEHPGLKYFGPNGETVKLYVRFFGV
jgi:hypothetical protein